MRTPAFSACLLVSALVVAGRADVTFDLSTAKLTLDAGAARWPR